MAAKRHYSRHDREMDRKNVRSYDRAEHEMAQHERDKFNDEHRSDKDRGGIIRKALTGAEMYAGMEPRRRRELEDAGMIHEDHRAIANLPQEVMIKPYAMTGPYLPEELDDTEEGVRRQMDYDDSQRRAHFYPKKV